MKYSQLKGQPNVLGTRRESLAPSLAVDSRFFPCLAYLEKGNGINTLNYSFWDGLKWAYNGTSKVYISQEDILFSPDSLILDNDNPYIVFARKIASGTRLSLAHYTSEWIFNDLDVDYEVGWIGVTISEVNLDHSSSSSSQSSETETNHYVVVYDSTNAKFRFYNATSGWLEYSSKLALVDDFSQIKISSCGQSYVGVAYVYDSRIIKYNFVNTSGWAISSFVSMASSQLYGSIIDMDFKGYFDNGKAYMTFGWLSRTLNTFYINSEACYYNPSVPFTTTELPTDGINTVIESNDIDVISSNYIINGYGKIGLCLKGLNPRLVAMGASAKIFTLDGTWSNDLIDISGISNGIVTDYLDVVYSDNSVKISITADSGNIYYFESDSSETFPISNPNMILLSEEWGFDTYFYPEMLVGDNIPEAYDNLIGGILKDAKTPLLITSNHALLPTTTTTTTGTGTTTTTTTATTIWCCTNFLTGPFIIFDGSGSGCILSNFVINVPRYSTDNCKIYVWAKSNVVVPGDLFVHFYRRIPSLWNSDPNIVATSYTFTTLPQTMSLLGVGGSGIHDSSFYWNGVLTNLMDFELGSYIYCP